MERLGQKLHYKQSCLMKSDVLILISVFIIMIHVMKNLFNLKGQTLNQRIQQVNMIVHASVHCLCLTGAAEESVARATSS